MPLPQAPVVLHEAGPAPWPRCLGISVEPWGVSPPPAFRSHLDPFLPFPVVISRVPLVRGDVVAHGTVTPSTPKGMGVWEHLGEPHGSLHPPWLRAAQEKAPSWNPPGPTVVVLELWQQPRPHGHKQGLETRGGSPGTPIMLQPGWSSAQAPGVE